MGLSEKRVPLDPLVNHHYPYIPYSNYYFGATHHLQTNPNAFDDFCGLTMFGMAPASPAFTRPFGCSEEIHRHCGHGPPAGHMTKLASSKAHPKRIKPAAKASCAVWKMWEFTWASAVRWPHLITSVLEKKDLLETRTPSFFHACRIE